MHNTDVARYFDEYADLLEIQGANPFRVRAYRNASRTVEGLSESVATLARQGATALTELEGIGDDLAEKIVTIVETGQLPQLEELRNKVPHDVRELLRIPGIGPKKVATLWKELGLKTLDQFQSAGERGEIAKLKGFGAKTEKLILEGLQQLSQTERRFYLADAKAAADELAADLLDSQTVTQAEPAGSCRRRKETCGDLDLLATAADSAAAMNRLAAHPSVEKVLARGDTKQRVRLRMGIEADLRVVPESSYGAAMQYFTGSKEHNIVLRRRAQERGLKLNEYGLFRGDELIAGATEEAVYAALDLPWIPPELRENRGEFELAEHGTLPELLELSDIRGDLHMHTTASDGTATIREMIDAAKARGLKYIAITDHSKRVSMANGLDAKRLRAHWKEIDRIRQQVSGIEVLYGVECDILEDATMDLADDVLAEADWVLASLHYGLRQPRTQIMDRLMCAAHNPHVDIIAHPSGRMIGKRPGADIDYTQLFQACADTGTLLEINAHPSRLDLDDVHAGAAAHEYGIPIVINSDAHSTGGLDVMEYGVYQARRAGLERKHVANSRTAAQFRKLIKS
ncbi:MAG: DNA polymerase/3'-5' exonuclease PolX [Planctomycetaceae bacterium]|nr:DNA polymerase/3'-5' exonuclease PolX [Planctomycetaceae bacterium]